MGERERSLIYELAKVQPDKLPLFPSRGQLFGIDSTVSAVDQLLATGETPRAAAWGKFPNGRYGLLVATDSRLIGLDKGVLTQTGNVQDIPYDMVKTISHKLGWLFGEITIHTFPSGSLSIGGVRKENVPAFASWVRNRLGAKGGESEMGRGEHTTTASLSAGRPPSLADELAKLAALRDSNVLSETEFLEAKKRLLNI